MLRVKSGRLGQTCLQRIPRDSEILRFPVRAGSQRVLNEPAPGRKRCEPRLSNFAPFRLRRVELRSVPELARAQVLSNFPNPVLDVLPAKAQRLTVVSAAPDNEVNVRVLRIVVSNRRPFEGRPEIVLHALDQTACQAGQIDAITKFR